MTTQKRTVFLVIYNGIKYVVSVFDGIINPDEEYVLSPVEELRGRKPIRLKGNKIKERELIVPHQN